MQLDLTHKELVSLKRSLQAPLRRQSSVNRSDDHSVASVTSDRRSMTAASSHATRCRRHVAASNLPSFPNPRLSLRSDGTAMLFGAR